MTPPAKHILVYGAFDDIRSRQLRFLEEASKLGRVTAVVWPDEAFPAAAGQKPRFPLDERVYFLNAIRYVSEVRTVGPGSHFNSLPGLAGLKPDIWVDDELWASPARQAFCQEHGLDYRVLGNQELQGFPVLEPPPSLPGRKKVIVTGCYDWFHSGHIRFFEEASSYGDLYVVVGHDANIRALKGDGHPLLPQEERRYFAQSIRYVTQALVSSGEGWLDADPEVRRIKPDIYAVNEDGDRGGKREYCAARGIDYLVLKREPAPGLPRRSSTELRGF